MARLSQVRGGINRARTGSHPGLQRPERGVPATGHVCIPGRQFNRPPPRFHSFSILRVKAPDPKYRSLRRQMNPPLWLRAGTGLKGQPARGESRRMARTFLTFGDIAGTLHVLRTECTRCARKGRYSVAKLLVEHGHRGNMSKWVSDLRGDCPKRNAAHLNERCDLICSDLPKARYCPNFRGTVL